MAKFDLGKKVGPLPTGVWIAVVGGGLILAYFVNRNMANAPTADVGAGVDSEVGRGGLTPISPSEEEGSSGEPEPEITDNQQWGNQAIRYLIATGIDPSKADQTIRKYLEGQSLTLAENAQIGLVLTRFGPPPQSISAVEEPVKEPDPVPGIKLVQAPSTRRAGFPLFFRGITTKDGKGAMMPVRIYLLREDGVWRQHALDGGGPGGNWTTMIPGGRAGQVKVYRFEARSGAKVARIQHTVKFT